MKKLFALATLATLSTTIASAAAIPTPFHHSAAYEHEKTQVVLYHNAANTSRVLHIDGMRYTVQAFSDLRVEVPVGDAVRVTSDVDSRTQQTLAPVAASGFTQDIQLN